MQELVNKGDRQTVWEQAVAVAMGVTSEMNVWALQHP